jgi:hypothetical protein
MHVPYIPSGDVLGQRTDVVEAERDGAEVVLRRLTRQYDASTDSGHALHLRGVNAVEMRRHWSTS